MISTCTLFFMVSMTQHFKFVLTHYMNVKLKIKNTIIENILSTLKQHQEEYNYLYDTPN